MVQPQAQVGSALQWEMTGGEAAGAVSQGSLRVPPELAANEIVHRLLGDNNQLREALRQSNVALRERCEEMEVWQQRSKKEREFLSCRFQEARALVERLSGENQFLVSQLSHSGAQTPKAGQWQDQNSFHTQGHELKNSLEKTQTVEMREKIADRQTPPESSFFQPSEFLQLLKSHKEKQEEGLRELRRRNGELEKEKEESERERDDLRHANAQLQSKLTQTQGCSVTEEAVQCSDSQTCSSDSSHLARLTEQLRVTQCSYKELQEKFHSLQKTIVHLDKTEAQLKQKEKDFSQLNKDSEVLKAQVTSLLGELNERQCCLDKSEGERVQLEEKLSEKTESLHCLRRDMDQLKQEHSVMVDKLRLHTESLEVALKKKRSVLTEEKRKLAQLQHAYTQMFQDYDAKLKNESLAQHRCGEVEDMANRLVEAERALALKQDLIDKLKEAVEQQRGLLETVPVFTAQAEIYKADFLAEREAREKLHQLKEELQEQLNQALADLARLRLEGTSRACMQQMQQRHLEDYRSAHSHLPPQGGGFPGATVPFSPAQPSSFRRPSVSEELPDFRCPKCQYQAPEMDTLQIHVMECIQ